MIMGEYIEISTQPVGEEIRVLILISAAAVVGCTTTGSTTFHHSQESGNDEITETKNITYVDWLSDRRLSNGFMHLLILALSK
jgi:hypothetical protein